MAVDMFLKLDGIQGESVDSKHKGEIDIESYSWGMTQTGSGNRGTGSGSGKVNVQDITITKLVDKSSPSLMQACANGKHIATGTITVRKAGENPLEYMTINMQNILVSNYQTIGTTGAIGTTATNGTNGTTGTTGTTGTNGTTGSNISDVPSEQVTLNFVQIQVEYWTQTSTGGKGENSNFGWNVAQNTSL